MYKFLLCFLILIFFLTCLWGVSGSAQTYTEAEIKAAEKKAVPSPVYGEIKKGVRLYSEASETGRYITSEKKQRVMIVKDYSLKWYYVELEDKKMWVKAENISIPSDGLTAKDALSDREIECYINTKGFESKTDRFIWVDIHRQQIYILKGRKSGFSMEKRMSCSTGKNCSPTTRGLFETSDKGEWFYSKRLESGAKYWVRFNGSYLFHSVAMDKEQNITDPVLGIRRSSGCVRTSVNDAKYIYQTIEKGTAVFVN